MSAPMSELEVLADVSARLTGAGIQFMLTGSFAMNFYATPRMTRDIDLVVELRSLRPATIAALFEPDYYASAEGISDAVVRGTLFNLIHQASVIKVDCILRKPDLFGHEAFRRRQHLSTGTLETWIISKEDLIVSKLKWAADTESERQLADVRNLVGTGFDADYVARWVRDLGLTRLWENTTAG